MLERVDGHAHEVTRDHVLRAGDHHAPRWHAQVGGSGPRFPGKLIHELVCRCARKKNPHLLSMAYAMPHVADQATVARGTMHRPMPSGAFAGGHCPRRRSQNPDTTQD
jgi:hypothetical protein